MHKDYSMTWMYIDKTGKIFPSVGSKDMKEVMNEIYVIKGRKYSYGRND